MRRAVLLLVLLAVPQCMAQDSAAELEDISKECNKLTGLQDALNACGNAIAASDTVEVCPEECKQYLQDRPSECIDFLNDLANSVKVPVSATETITVGDYFNDFCGNTTTGTGTDSTPATGTDSEAATPPGNSAMSSGVASMVVAVAAALALAAVSLV